MGRLEFTVLGEPQPQGSKTVVQQKGRRPRMIEDNPDTKPWRERVERAARAAMNGAELHTGPLRLTAIFVMPRPKSHFGTGRNAGRLKPTAPLYVTTRPDTDKLLRAIGDGMKGHVYRDDSQIVISHGEMHYGEPTCAWIAVDEIDPELDRPGPDPLGSDAVSATSTAQAGP